MSKNQNENLIKYLQILLVSSNSFKKELLTFNEKHKNKTGDDLMNIVEQIMKDFFIPSTEENKILIQLLLRNNDIAPKYNIYINDLASPERPGNFKYDVPSVIVQIHGDINSEEEWLGIWNDIKKADNSLKKDHGPNFSFLRKLKGLKPNRKHSNIDFDLELYRRHKVNLASPIRLAKDQSDIKNLVGKNDHTVYTAQELERRLLATSMILENI
jgi:hypothetical protein